jgi:hypothetical protein
MFPCVAKNVKKEDKGACSSIVSPINVTYQVPFYLPPVKSSSSSSTSSNLGDIEVEQKVSIYQVPFNLPIPGTHSSSSCCCDSNGTTPVISSTALTLLQLGGLTSACSPLLGKVLNYPSPTVCCSSTIYCTEEDSPFPIKTRIPFKFRIMEDDNDECTIYDEETDTEMVEDVLDVQCSLEPDDLLDLNSVSLTDIAKGMVNDADDSTMDASELALILNSSVNTKQYEKNKKGIELRFFDTLDKFGGPLLRTLTKFAQDGFKKERLFYVKLKGDKSEEKRFILNKCLVKAALKMAQQQKGERLW